MNNKTQKIIISALFTALTCVATMVIKVPTPTSGYIHLGDGLVLLSGIILGPVYGSIAAGLGSMFADLFSGYAGFAPATLIIKALAALIGGLLYHLINHLFSKSVLQIIPIILAGIGGGFIVTSGYFIFEAFIMGLGVPAAFAGVPFNLLQNLFGIIIAAILVPLLGNIQIVKEFMLKA